MLNIASLILAAGSGRRYGQPKALVERNGKLLLETAITQHEIGGSGDIYVVLGASHLDVLKQQISPFIPVVNNDWEKGLSSSLAAGLRALPSNVDGCVITLVDQPYLDARDVASCVEAANKGASIVMTRYAQYDMTTHPIYFARSHFDEIMRTSHGDRGARDFLAAHADDIEFVSGLGNPKDIDTPGDWVN